jgi:hypothetical protein
MNQPPPERPPNGQPGLVGGAAGPGQDTAADPASPGGRGGRTKLPLTAVVVALLVVLAAAGVLTRTPGGGDPLSPTAASESVPAAPSAPSDPAGFLARLPLGFTDCVPATRAGDGDLAAAVCRAAAGQPDLVQAAFHLYPDQATLDAVFEGQATTEWTLSPFADGAGCATAPGYGPWSHSDQSPGGQLACQITGEGDVLVGWTDDDALAEGIVWVPGNSQAELAALYDWWTSHRDFRP